MREELRTRTVLVPSVREEERERAVTTVHCVPEVVCKPVVEEVHVAVSECDPCTGRGFASCATFPQIGEEAFTVNRRVAETHLERYTAAVPCLRPEEQTVKVCVPSSHEEVRTESVPVTTLKPRKEVYKVRVPVRHEEVETYEVPVTVLVPQKEVYHERVPDSRPEVRTRKVTETVYKTAPEVVTERVAFTTCVKVPCKIQVWAPCGCP